jgi:hypothetical protein
VSRSRSRNLNWAARSPRPMTKLRPAVSPFPGLLLPHQRHRCGPRSFPCGICTPATVSAESPTLGPSHLQFEAILSRPGRQPTRSTSPSSRCSACSGYGFRSVRCQHRRPRRSRRPSGPPRSGPRPAGRQRGTVRPSGRRRTSRWPGSGYQQDGVPGVGWWFSSGWLGQ